MPPASSPGSDLALSRATTRERAARVRYRRALMLMTMTLVVPGSAQLAAGQPPGRPDRHPDLAGCSWRSRC